MSATENKTPAMRDRIDAMVKHMVDGGSSVKYAKEKAIHAAKKVDRKNNK